MALRDEVLADPQHILWDVIIDGARVADAFEASVSLGIDQVTSQATIVVPSRPSWVEEGKAVEIWAGHNGITQQIFGGEVVGLDWETFAPNVGIDARGALYRTMAPWGGDDKAYSSQDDAAVIRNILESYGIPNTRAHIESSGWTLGTIQDVTWANGQPGWQLIEEIDTIAGYRTFVGPDGVIYRRRFSGAPSTSGLWHFQEAVDIISVQRRRSIDGIVNKAVVTGLTYEGLEVTGSASADNPYIPNPPGYATEDIQSDLIETDAKAGEVAERYVGDHNRRPEGLELETLGNPLMQPGVTVKTTHADVEAAAALTIVTQIQHALTSSSFLTSLTTDGGTLSGYQAGAPVAQFDLKIFQEYHAVLGNIAVLVADGGASFDPDSETALSYAWSGTVPGGTIAPGTATTSVYRALITGTATGGTVTLICTDADSLSGTATRPFSLEGTASTREQMFVAEGGTIAASDDGQRSWRTATATNATSLAAFGSDWGNIWGTHGGTVIGSTDVLRTALNFGTPFGGSAVTGVSIHELDTSRLWAGGTAGQIAQGSYDATTGSIGAWEVRGTAPQSPIREIRESYSSFLELYLTAGSSLYRSGDGAATFEELATFDGGTAYRMAASMVAGVSYNFVGGAGAAPIVELGGAALDWPGGTPTAVPALTTGWRTPELYAASGDGSAVLYRGTIGATTRMSAAATVPAQVHHMIRSGNADGKIYLATSAGVYEWLPQLGAGTVFALRTANPAFMVGYGLARATPGIAATTIVSALTAIGLNLGTGTPTPPSGWYLIGYNDSAWASVVAGTSAISLSGATQIRAAAATSDETYLIRQDFTLPSGIISAATLEVEVEDGLTDLYINDVLIGSIAPAGVGSAGSGTFTVPVSALVTGTNVLACRVTNDSASQTGICYKLTVT